MPRGIPNKAKTLTHPAKGEEWRERFKTSAVRVGFQISLTRTMLEFICAVSDDVDWDRSKFGGMVHPDNFIAVLRALEKRGLIEKKSEEECEKVKRLTMTMAIAFEEETYWKLTPAGIYVVQLVKMAGIFVKADAAFSKEARKA